MDSYLMAAATPALVVDAFPMHPVRAGMRKFMLYFQSEKLY